jgi:hypothetical protein
MAKDKHQHFEEPDSSFSMMREIEAINERSKQLIEHKSVETNNRMQADRLVEEGGSYSQFVPGLSDAIERERERRVELGNVLSTERIMKIEETANFGREGLVNELIESAHIHSELEKIKKDLSN